MNLRVHLDEPGPRDHPRDASPSCLYGIPTSYVIKDPTAVWIGMARSSVASTPTTDRRRKN